MAYLQPFSITINGTDSIACKATQEVWEGVACLCDGVAGPVTDCSSYGDVGVDYLLPTKSFQCAERDGDPDGNVILSGDAAGLPVTGDCTINGGGQWLQVTVQSPNNADGSGGTNNCAIRASGNVEKVVRSGTNTGEYTVHFDTDMPDANYVMVGNAVGDYGSGHAGQFTGHVNINTPNEVTAATCVIQVSRNLSGSEADSAYNSEYVTIAFFR